MVNDDPECDAEVRRPRLDLGPSDVGKRVDSLTDDSPIVPDHVIGKGRENLLSWVPYFIKELMVDRSSASDSNAIEYFGTDSHSMRNIH